MLKGLMGSVLLKCNVPEAASQAASRFTSFVDGNGHCSEGEGSTSPSSSSSAAAAALLSPDVRGAVYSSVARNGGQDGMCICISVFILPPIVCAFVLFSHHYSSLHILCPFYLFFPACVPIYIPPVTLFSLQTFDAYCY